MACNGLESFSKAFSGIFLNQLRVVEMWWSNMLRKNKKFPRIMLLIWRYFFTDRSPCGYEGRKMMKTSLQCLPSDACVPPKEIHNTIQIVIPLSSQVQDSHLYCCCRSKTTKILWFASNSVAHKNGCLIQILTLSHHSLSSQEWWL